MSNQVAARLDLVRVRICEAAKRAGRDPSEITLVAVSKKQPIEKIEVAYQSGVRAVGENYVQEMNQKIAETRAIGLHWHYIGRLQRNKVKAVVGQAALIHAVDSERLLREIQKRAAAADLVQSLLISVNVAGEISKGGLSKSEAADLLSLGASMKNVSVEGLMTMPPLAIGAAGADQSRPYFRILREMRDELSKGNPALRYLSMGTSGDFEVAIEEGATHVRVGSLIFGQRPNDDTEKGP